MKQEKIMIDYEPIDLHTLRLASYLFEKMTAYDEAYQSYFSQEVDILTAAGIEEMMKFLKAWGCVQVSFTGRRQSMVAEIQQWYRLYHKMIVEFPAYQNLSEQDFQCIEKVFTDLSNRKAISEISGNSSRIGPVAASKILLLLRGDIFAPLDNPIADELNIKPSALTYIDYLKRIYQHLKDLTEQATKAGTTIAQYVFESPIKIASKPLPKLIDQYFFIRYTRKWQLDELIQVVHQL